MDVSSVMEQSQLRVVPLAPSPSCLTRKKTAGKILQVRSVLFAETLTGFLGAIFFLAVYLRSLALNGLGKRMTTCSPVSGLTNGNSCPLFLSTTRLKVVSPSSVISSKYHALSSLPGQTIIGRKNCAWFTLNESVWKDKLSQRAQAIWKFPQA